MPQLWNNRGRGIQYFRDHPFQVTLTAAGIVAGYAIGNIADTDRYAEIDLNWFDAAGTSIGMVVGNISGRVVDHDVMQSRRVPFIYYFSVTKSLNTEKVI